MRRFLVFFVVSALPLSVASAAHAQFFGQFGPYGARAEEGFEFGGCVGHSSATSTHEYGVFTENDSFYARTTTTISTTGVTAHVYYGLDSSLGIGFQAAIAEVSDGGPTVLGTQLDGRFGAEVYKTPTMSGRLGVTAASASALSLYSGSSSLVEAAFSVVPGGSLSVSLENGMAIHGWGGYGPVLEIAKYSRVDDFKINVNGLMRLGGEFDPMPNLGVVAELQIRFANGDRTTSLTAGLSFLPEAKK